MELRVLPDSQAALLALESGAVDWLSGCRAQTRAVSRLTRRTRSCLPGVVARSTTWAWMCSCRRSQINACGRRSATLNRQRMVDIALSGYGRPASIVWPQQSLAYDATLDQTYTYDPARARQLLDAAGWDANTVVPLSVPNGAAVSLRMAEIVQADLANIGVQVAVQTLNQPDFVARLQRAQFSSAWIIAMGFMNLSPPTFFQTAFAARVQNGSNFLSQQYQDLINGTFGTTDDRQLQQGLRGLTQIMLDEAFVMPIAEGAGQQAYRRSPARV